VSGATASPGCIIERTSRPARCAAERAGADVIEEVVAAPRADDGRCTGAEGPDSGGADVVIVANGSAPLAPTR
jgi:hypothetical protein